MNINTNILSTKLLLNDHLSKDNHTVVITLKNDKMPLEDSKELLSVCRLKVAIFKYSDIDDIVAANTVASIHKNSVSVNTHQKFSYVIKGREICII